MEIFEKDDLKFFVPACPNSFLSRCGEISLQPSQGALFYGRGCSAGCEDNFDFHEVTAPALSGYAGQCENTFDGSVLSSENALVARAAAFPVRKLDASSPAARCGEDSFNGPLLDFENSLLGSESGYSMHCLNSPNSLIRHPSMHAPSLARELIVGRGGVVGAVGCREGEVVHVHRCDDDACMDDVNSVIQEYGSHATACSSLDALHNSRWARGHCLRGGTQCSSTGSRDQVWLSDESKDSFSHQEPQSLHVEAWAGSQECPPRWVSRSGSFQLGVLQCPSLLVFLFSLLRYLGQAVGRNWRKLRSQGCGFSGVPFKGMIFFHLLPKLLTGNGRDRTKQRGRSLGVPRAHVHMRMGMAQLSGHIREGGVEHCSRTCGGLMSLP